MKQKNVNSMLEKRDAKYTGKFSIRMLQLNQLGNPEDEKEQMRIEGRQRYESEIIAATHYGREEGEDRFAKLSAILLQNQRIDDLAKASSDKNFRNQLFQELGI